MIQLSFVIYTYVSTYCIYTGCERYLRPFLTSTLKALSNKKNEPIVMKLSGFVYNGIEHTFSK